MIRKAVGAIVIQANEVLLVHKVKMMEGQSGPEQISGEWDFPKGGVKSTDSNVEAILRELKEETGSNAYNIIKEYNEKICFSFSTFIQQKIGYKDQETTMFLVEYTGDRGDLQPQDEEISQVLFFPKSNVLDRLYHEDSKRFYKEFVPESLS
jgi:putative (di)nucleoside polyphosphate hydrolase